MAFTKTVNVETTNARASTTLTDITPTVPLPDMPQGLMVIGPQVTLHFVEGEWNQANSYDYYDVVQVDGTSYIAVQDVPANTEITDTEYWAKWNDPNAQLEQIQKSLQQVVDVVDNSLTKPLDVVYNGADPTGVKDSTTAFKQTVDYANRLTFAVITIPEGVYVLSDTIEFPQTVKFLCEGNVKIISSAPTAFWLNPKEITGNTYQWLYQATPYFRGGMHIQGTNGADIALKIGSDTYLNGNQNVTAWSEFYDLTITGFNTAIEVTQYSNYLMTFMNLQFSGCNKCVDLFDGSNIRNSGEAIKFLNCVFGDVKDIAIDIHQQCSVYFVECSFDYIKNIAINVADNGHVYVDDCYIEGIGKNLPTDTLDRTAKFVYTKGSRSNCFIDNTEVMVNCTNVVDGDGYVKFSNCKINALPNEHGYFLGKNTTIKNSIESSAYQILPPDYFNSLVTGDFSTLTVGTAITAGMAIFGNFKNKYTADTNISVVNDAEMGKAIEIELTSNGAYLEFEATVPVEPGASYIANFNVRSPSQAFIHRGANVTYKNGDTTISTSKGDVNNNNTINANELTPLWGKNVFIAPAGADTAVVTFIVNPQSQMTFTAGQFGFFKIG